MRDNSDILICDTPTGFENIIKKVSCALIFAVNHVNFDYFFKTDDDSTLCMGKMMTEIREKSSGGPVYLGRSLKWSRGMKPGKPLEVNLGLTKDPPHFGGHGYGVSYGSAKYIAWLLSNFPVYHHLHEDTNFGLWMLPLSVVRLRLKSLEEYIKRNQASIID